MTNERILFFDLESDDLTPVLTTIWCICTSFEGEERTFLDKASFKAYIDNIKPDVLVGHNISTFDCEALRRVYGVDYSIGKEDTFNGFPCDIRDTLLISQMMNADREGGHSLDNFGRILGFPKGNHKDWSKLSDEMIEYCRRDVALSKKTYEYLMRDVNNYGVDSFFK